MKSSKLMRAAAAMLCAVIAFAGLSACVSSSNKNEASDSSKEIQRPQSDSNSNNEQKNEPEETKKQTFTQMFNGKQTIWFYRSNNSVVAKDDSSETIFVFDHGKVTTYIGDFPFADFKDVPDSKVLDKVKELHKVSFNQKMAGKNIQYRDPQPYDVTFNSISDQTGNGMEGEIINIKYWSQSLNQEKVFRLLFETNLPSYTESPVKTQIVYDKQFTGFTQDGRLFFGRMSEAGGPEPVMPSFDSLNNVPQETDSDVYSHTNGSLDE
ncbi:hypothetical protein OZX62_06145 [Bifidobacterium sp. ESL0690]|uniref:hypothetical protein n=1 Tax=Bifidobacterium sp. ESL0690 TaxID=2983214 RepID=UPI0023FA111B|nr:hypothetical protein [Bifidobacterium sp. ESL0690]WEV46043.1 hypothetical protein OZX62_06145 [Bifidobacterium sp. ESL0690]